MSYEFSKLMIDPAHENSIELVDGRSVKWVIHDDEVTYVRIVGGDGEMRYLFDFVDLEEDAKAGIATLLDAMSFDFMDMAGIDGDKLTDAVDEAEDELAKPRERTKS